MRTTLFSVILPASLIVLGLCLVLLGIEYGIFAAGAGALWLILSFLIGYKDDEAQPQGMGRGRER